MSGDNHSIQLSDGRTLGYAEYGDPAGWPIIGFHGLPGSRIWYESPASVSDLEGIRLVTLDRPGFGLSSPHAGRTILDFTHDTISLADALGIDQFSVLGVSGGGVYAAGIAHQYANRIFKAGLVATINEFQDGRPPRDMSSANTLMFRLARMAPPLLRFALKRQRKFLLTQPDKYKKYVQLNVKHLCSADQQLMANEEVAIHLMAHTQEAFRQGVDETVAEARLLTRPWGFSVEEITIPVEIWHGVQDTLAPVAAIQELANQIATCVTHYLEGKGHLLTDDEEIWQQILLTLRP